MYSYVRINNTVIPVEIADTEECPIRHSAKPNITDRIRDVIFNDPATIVKWTDGTKTVVKAQKGDTYSKEVGLAMCIVKKMCGNKGNYNDVFAKWCK